MIDISTFKETIFTLHGLVVLVNSKGEYFLHKILYKIILINIVSLLRLHDKV